VTYRRLPAYSGATVPELHRVPVASAQERRFVSRTRLPVILLAAVVLVARIVSLIPSLTEDLFALGAGSTVVAVSEYTDYPPPARKLPRISTAFNVDAERVVALHPDVVLGIPSQAGMAAPLVRAHLRVELIRNDTFDDIFTTLTRLGKLLGRETAASALERRLRAQTTALLRSVNERRHPRVFVVLDTTPLYTAGKGSYINTLLEMAGATNVATIRTPYAQYSAETVVADQPDLILADRNAGFDRVLQNEPWRSLRAVKNGNVAYIPKDQALLRPGPRYNEGLKWLIALMHRVSS
jgi:iron complex transport system substrate-binding protein